MPSLKAQRERVLRLLKQAVCEMSTAEQASLDAPRDYEGRFNSYLRELQRAAMEAWIVRDLPGDRLSSREKERVDALLDEKGADSEEER